MMRGLSIRQPWAFSIIPPGTKRVENRGWNTSFRGFFLIHAALGCTMDEVWGWADALHAENLVWPEAKGRVYRPTSFDRGGIVGSAQLVDVVKHADTLPAEQRGWFFGPYGFVLDDVRPIPFIPCKGALGFFTIAPEIEAKVRSILA